MDKAPDAFRTISEVADDLRVPQHVLRFWETRFPQIRPMKRAGGRRYYRPDDVDLLRGIHHLLYGEGYTIRGVQRILKDSGPKFVQTVWQRDAEDEPALAGEPERRGLLSVLPSLLAKGETGSDVPSPEADEDDEPESDAAAERDPHPVAPRVAAASAPRQETLQPDQIRKLQDTLNELAECRRLLEETLGAGGGDASAG
ncbi:MAG: MerR family transcriptional regulator [Pseudorhodoplanes sp.]